MSNDNRLPFGSEFSPSQIDLVNVLELAEHHGGDWHAFADAIRLTYFEDHDTSQSNRVKLANNTKLGMIAYGIIDRNANLTDFGYELFALRRRTALFVLQTASGPQPLIWIIYVVFSNSFRMHVLT